MPRTPEQNESIKAQTRNVILEAAFPLFSKNGFDRTSMATIAKEAGISKGLIYHHFNSKEEVLVGVFDLLMNQSADIWNVFDEVKSAHEKFDLMLDMTLKFSMANPEWVRLLVHLALQEDVVASLKEHIRVLRVEKMRSMIPLFEELGFEDAEKEVLYLGALLDGVTIGWLSLRDEYPFEEMIDRIKTEYHHKVGIL